MNEVERIINELTHAGEQAGIASKQKDVSRVSYWKQTERNLRSIAKSLNIDSNKIFGDAYKSKSGFFDPFQPFR